MHALCNSLRYVLPVCMLCVLNKPFDRFMYDVFILQNQHQQYMDKHGEWVDGRESQMIYRTPHKDEAINLKVEHTVRHPDLRLRVISVKLDDKGRIQIADSQSSSTSIDSTAPELFTETQEICDDGEVSDTI